MAEAVSNLICGIPSENEYSLKLYCLQRSEWPVCVRRRNAAYSAAVCSSVEAADRPHRRMATVMGYHWSIDMTEILNLIALQCPLLEGLDLRNQSYDTIGGIVTSKGVDVGSSEFRDFVPILPEFSNLKALRLPLPSTNGDANEPSIRLDRQLPSSNIISKMRRVAFQGCGDKYKICCSAPAGEDAAVTCLYYSSASAALWSLPLYSLFENFAWPETLGTISDVAVSFIAV